MSKEKTNGTRKVKELNLSPGKTSTSARKYTKAGELEKLLSKGATMDAICVGLSKTGAEVTPPVARSWMRYLNESHGYGVKTNVNKKTQVTTYHLIKARAPEVTV